MIEGVFWTPSYIFHDKQQLCCWDKNGPRWGIRVRPKKIKEEEGECCPGSLWGFWGEKSAVMVVLSFTDSLRLQLHMQADSAAQSHCSLNLSMKRGPPQQLTFCHRMLVVVSCCAYQLLWWPSCSAPKKIKNKLPFSPWGVIFCLLKGVFPFPSKGLLYFMLHTKFWSRATKTADITAWARVCPCSIPCGDHNNVLCFDGPPWQLTFWPQFNNFIHLLPPLISLGAAKENKGGRRWTFPWLTLRILRQKVSCCGGPLFHR